MYAKPIITSVEIYRRDGLWCYAAYTSEDGFDHSDVLNAETELQARREISAMFTGSDVVRVEDC